jgi:hypothetical protein
LPSGLLSFPYQITNLIYVLPGMLSQLYRAGPWLYGNEGRKDGRKARWMEGRKTRRREGRKKGRQDGRNARRKEGRKAKTD